MSFSPKQQEYFCKATHRWNVKTGATRSGKTFMDYYVIPKRIRAVSGNDGLIVILGHTKGTIQRNIIEPLQRIWGTALVSDIKSDDTATMFGEKVYCLPSKANPWSTWWWPTPEIPTDRDFDKFCNEYQYYNCNAETGKRLAFYKEVM